MPDDPVESELPDDPAETDPVATELTALRDAREAYEDAVAAVDEYGVDRLETVTDALQRARRLLDRYEGDATGTGDFQAYVEFEGEFETLVDDLPDDLPGREVFERANETVDQRRLSEEDFDRARETLAELDDLAGRLSVRETAETELEHARRDARRRIDEIDDRIETLERLRRFGDADLSAPTEELRDPVAAYDDAVREAFETFRREAPARRLLSVVADTTHYPFVEFQPPPAELRSYLADAPVGEESVTTLLEYESYSASKLDHYVPDAGAFQRAVGVHRGYLDRLGPEPLVVGWPPPAAGVLRVQGEELVSVTAKFADESVVARARQLPRLARRDDYDRLRTAARAATELTDDQRDRLASGAVDRELSALREGRRRLSSALDRRLLE